MSDFTPEQIAEWKRIADLYVREKGKPTPEQIEKQKAQSALKDSFLETLGATTKGAKKKLSKSLDAALKGPKKKQAQGPKKINEEDLDPSAYTENRLKALAAKEAEGRVAYPHKFHVSHTHAAFVEQFDGLKVGESKENESVSIAGRVQYIRSASKKLVFIDLQSSGLKIQIMAALQNYGRSPELFQRDLTEIRRGDIIGVVGYPGRTKTGELSVMPKSIDVLSPCLAMLPKNNLKDKETRYRKRYLDLIMNDSRDIFYKRAQIIHYVRAFLDSQDFLEVETPMMNVVAGGATARPFETYHNDLQQKMYMRVAPELYVIFASLAACRMLRLCRVNAVRDDEETHVAILINLLNDFVSKAGLNLLNRKTVTQKSAERLLHTRTTHPAPHA